jgi:hypothetical protein
MMLTASASAHGMSPSGATSAQSAGPVSTTPAGLTSAPDVPVGSAVGAKPAEEFTVPSVQFISEQDGQVEKALESKLIRLFNSRGDVARAYLVRVSYASTPGQSVALAISGDRVHASEIVQAVGSVFAGMFNSNEHLDTIFINDREEARLVRVCAPFYDRSHKPPPG